jgi:hypothetical protein
MAIQVRGLADEPSDDDLTRSRLQRQSRRMPFLAAMFDTVP